MILLGFVAEFDHVTVDMFYTRRLKTVLHKFKFKRSKVKVTG